MGGGPGPCVSGRECSGSRQIVLKEKSEKNGNPGPFARFIDSRVTELLKVLDYINSTFHYSRTYDAYLSRDHEVRCAKDLSSS